jgi:hypothetical protein
MKRQSGLPVLLSDTITTFSKTRRIRRAGKTLPSTTSLNAADRGVNYDED